MKRRRPFFRLLLIAGTSSFISPTSFETLPHFNSKSVAMPRQIAMYLAKQMTPRSLPEIGRKFGGRDHTTVLHACRKVEELMKSDLSLAEDVDMLRRMLET